MNYRLETHPGNSFHEVAKQARQLSRTKGKTVEFAFNGITCLVRAFTDLDWLWRDYLNAHKLGWEYIGPDCVEFYSQTTQATLDRINQEQEQKDARQRIEQQKRDDASRESFEKKTAGIVLDLTMPEAFEAWKDKNTDSYGACIFEYVEGWAKLMQREMSEGKDLEAVAEPTSFELGFLGITGFMYGAAVNVLAHHWKHGEALRVWHNKKYKHSGSGVVNPAVLSISTQP